MVCVGESRSNVVLPVVGEAVAESEGVAVASTADIAVGATVAVGTVTIGSEA